jgi:hypothetical protein
MADVPVGIFVPPGGSITITLSASLNADANFVAFSSALFDTLNVNAGHAGDITDWKVLNQMDDLTGDLTTTDGDSLFGTIASQSILFGPFTSDNPIDILQFTWQSNGLVGDVAYQTHTAAASIWAGDSMDTARLIDVEASEANFGWIVQPAPGSVSVFGLGGFLLARRRR